MPGGPAGWPAAAGVESSGGMSLGCDFRRCGLATQAATIIASARRRVVILELVRPAESWMSLRVPGRVSYAGPCIPGAETTTWPSISRKLQSWLEVKNPYLPLP